MGADIVSERADVVVVGGGPSGLAAATALRRAGAGRVVVVEREAEAGGIPRHAHHQGYGMRDEQRVLTGPDYASRCATHAAAAGAELRTSTQVTGWTDAGALELTGPAGRGRLQARAVVLATGCRERPRSARLVAGTRPQGVMTTGMLQQLVSLRGEAVGSRAVIVGAEHVSYSALATLSHGGARSVAMVTDQPRHQSYTAFRLGAAVRFRASLHTATRVEAIHGKRRVEGVTLTDLDGGHARELACDLVVFSAGWIPDHELAVLAGVELDPVTRGPAVDAALRTSRPGVFAAGNLLHGAETADVAALTGRHVAVAVVAHLADAPWPTRRVAIRCNAPLDWVVPNVVSPADSVVGPPRGRYGLRARAELLAATVRLTQDGHELWAGRLPRVMPGRSARLPSAWAAAVDPAGGDVVAAVVRARRRS